MDKIIKAASKEDLLKYNQQEKECFNCGQVEKVETMRGFRKKDKNGFKDIFACLTCSDYSPLKGSSPLTSI